MRRALGAATAALVLLAGCGGEDESDRLIPATRAVALRSTLAQLEDARSAGRCIEARSLAQEARRQAEGLPTTVDRELRRRIRRGISRIFELLPAQCRSEAEEEETPPTTTEPPADTEPPPPTEPPAETTEPTTSEPPAETTPPTTPTPTTPQPGGGPGSGGSGTGGTPGTEDEG